MEQHLFKIIFSDEDDVYRIIDLTDTSIVGVTEMYESWLEGDREMRAERNRDIREKKELGVKINNYGIFIFLDEENTKPQPASKDDYIRSVLRQMAVFFKEEVIDNNPKKFEDYLIRKPSDKKPPVQKTTTDRVPSTTYGLSNKPKITPEEKKENFIIEIVIFILVIAANAALAIVIS